MMLIVRSAAKVYSGSKPISGLPESFRALSGNVAGVPVLVLVVAVLYVVAHLVLTRTKLGRYSYAIGGNEQAAWLSGVRVGRYKVAIYALSGLTAGVAAVLMTSRLNAASPSRGDVRAVRHCGGGDRRGEPDGREGGVLGTLVGALIMGTLRNGLNALNVPSALEGMVVGGCWWPRGAGSRPPPRRGGGTGEEWRRRRALVIAGVGAVVVVSAALGFRMASRAPARARTLTVAFVPRP